MNDLVKWIFYMSMGVVAGVAVVALLMGEAPGAAAEHAPIPLGIGVSMAIYSRSRRQSVGYAFALAIPIMLASVAVKSLLWPLPGGFSWVYVLALGGTAGGICACSLPVIVRLGRRRRDA